MELLISHNGKYWIATHDDGQFIGQRLADIDTQVRRFVRETRVVRKGQKLRVKMFFDTRAIPQWMRQYSQHYFNRILEVEG